MIEAVGTSGLRRLLDYVRAYRADHDTPPPVRREQTLRSDLHLPPQSARSGRLPASSTIVTTFRERSRRWCGDCGVCGGFHSS